jgi:hypothetical protein
VTVWTEHPKILYPIVISDPIDVVDLNAEGLTPPVRYPTRATAISKYTSLEQIPLYGLSRSGCQDKLKGLPAGACAEVSAVNRLRPRGSGKSETPGALSVGVPFIIKLLDQGPIELPAAITVGCRRDP